jgi:hypothetical protein
LISDGFQAGAAGLISFVNAATIALGLVLRIVWSTLVKASNALAPRCAALIGGFMAIKRIKRYTIQYRRYHLDVRFTRAVV